MQYEEALRKVKALLKLAERGGTQEEAALAASKAQEIMDKYKLDVDSLDFEENNKAEDSEQVKDFGYEDPLDIAKYGNYRESWTVRLASVVSQHNQTRIVYGRKADKSTIIKIIGRASDVQTVRYLYSFFKQQIEQLQKQHTAGNSPAYKGQFAFGCIDTLSVKLNAQRKSTFAEKRQEFEHNPNALVKVNNAIARIEKRAMDVDLFIKSNIKFRKGGGFHGSSTPTGGRDHGRKAGESIRMTGAKGSLGSGQRQIS